MPICVAVTTTVLSGSFGILGISGLFLHDTATHIQAQVNSVHSDRFTMI